jgi:anhydro-N-acetylmuramic acid kinase
MKKNRYLSLGIMSGTSNDGIDLSLIQSDGVSKFDVLSSKYIKYNSDLVRDLNDLTNNINKLSIYSSRIIQIQDRVTKSYIDAIKKFKKSNHSKIDLISLHGQTIFHDPYKKISIQLCNAELIKSEFNSHIVYDFRQNDLKYGGQGAPLVPVFHKLMNNNLSLSGTNAFLNIGGVSNITIIKNSKIISAFDVGPGMAILNDYVFLKKKKFYDKNGADSSKGKINKNLIISLMKDNFFKKIHQSHWIKTILISLDF